MKKNHLDKQNGRKKIGLPMRKFFFVTLFFCASCSCLFSLWGRGQQELGGLLWHSLASWCVGLATRAQNQWSSWTFNPVSLSQENDGVLERDSRVVIVSLLQPSIPFIGVGTSSELEGLPMAKHWKALPISLRWKPVRRTTQLYCTSLGATS